VQDGRKCVRFAFKSRLHLLEIQAYFDCLFQNAALYESNGGINYTKTGQHLAKSQKDDYFRGIIERGTVKYGWFERTCT
jgi:hypothetical protein